MHTVMYLSSATALPLLSMYPVTTSEPIIGPSFEKPNPIHPVHLQRRPTVISWAVLSIFQYSMRSGCSW